MEFLLNPTGACRSLALFPGSFHPVTRAHLALARAALDHLDRVLFVLPRHFPHKQYEDVPLAHRMEILISALQAEHRFSAAISDGGLFIEMVRECGPHYPEQTTIWMLCGRDAAERIVEWDYTDGPSLPQQLKEFGLLVAARQGDYIAPAHLRDHIRTLPLPTGYDHISATLIRRLIRNGEPWEHLVPEAALPLVRRHYTR